MENVVNKFKNIVIIFVCLRVLDIIFYGFKGLLNGSDLISQILSLILSLVIFYFLYKGYNWLRIAYTILAIIGSIFSIFGILVVFSVSFIAGIISILLLLFNVYVVIFINSEEFKAFQRAQRNN